MKKALVILVVLFYGCYQSSAQTACDTIYLADTARYCLGDTAFVTASVPTGYAITGINWSPNTEISDTASFTPYIHSTASRYYTLSVKSLVPGNLVTNGDFSSGNTGFSSSYGYSAPPRSILYENFYSVYTDPYGVHTGFTRFGDHTSGTGNMMIINGGYYGSDVWCQTITVTPYTDYDFSAWSANCSSTSTGAYAPILQFKINGVLIGAPDTISASPGTWVNFNAVWNSGASTTAVICIYDALTTAGGNDFVIDDISFQKYCVKKDSIYIDVKLPDTVTTSNTYTLCDNAGSLTLHATSGYSAYLWNTGATDSFTTVSTSGLYTAVSSGVCSVIMDSFAVRFDPFVSEVYTKDTGLCFPGTHTLFAPAGYSNYVWNNGSTNTAYEVTSTGKYVVRSFAYCYERSDTINVNFTPYTFSLGPDTTVCMNYLLTAPIPKEGVATYRWQDGTPYPTYSAYRTGIYYVTVDNNGCIATDTIAVTFRRLVQNIRDTFVCKHEAINYPVSCTPPADGTVMWNDGITATRRTFTDSGTWWVYVSAGDCQILDTVRITTDYCECWHQIPDAFTPNGDGRNDVARPVIQPGCNISGYYFSLYNRWGELVFTSDSRDEGWDGTYKGTACDIGVYMYVVNFYVGVKNTHVMKSGTITLVR